MRCYGIEGNERALMIAVLHEVRKFYLNVQDISFYRLLSRQVDTCKSSIHRMALLRKQLFGAILHAG